MAANDNVEKLIMRFEAQNTDVMRKLNQIEKQNRKTFSKGEKQVKSFNMQMKKSATLAKGLAGSLAGFAGIAGGAGVAGLVAGMQSAAESVASLASEAERAGVSFEAFQELKYAAEQSQVSVDALTDGLKEMQLRADEFVLTGQGSGAEAFQRLGYEAEDLKTKLKEPDQLFEDIIGKLQQLDKSAQIRVADEIFGGTGGEQFVQLLDQGVEGLQQARMEARSLGLVMSEDVGANAERINQEFNKLSGIIGTNLKSAIIQVGSLLDSWGLPDKLMQDIAAVGALLNNPSLANLEAVIGSSLTSFSDEAQKTVELRRKLLAGQTSDFSGFEDLLDSRATDSGTTSVPSSGFNVPDTGARAKAAAAAKKEAEAVQKVIDNLKAEQAALGMTTAQQRVMNELRSAGSGATDEQKQQIEQLVNSIDQQNQKMQAAQYVQDQFQNAAMSAFGELTSQINTGNDALDTLIQNLINATAQAALFGSGPLAGLFGGGGNGFLGSLFGGFFADGGNLGAGKWGVAGENGPELIKGPANVVPASKMGNGTTVAITNQIDATGADPAQLARVTVALAQMQKELPRTIVAVTNQQQSRGYA